MANHESEVLACWQYRANPMNQFHAQYHKMCNRIFGTMLFWLVEAFVVVTFGWWEAVTLPAKFVLVVFLLFCVVFLCWVVIMAIVWFVYWLSGREISHAY